MPITVGDAVLWLRTDSSQMTRGLASAEGEVKSWGGRVGGFVSNALSFATGTIVVQGINRVTGALSGMATEAFGAVSSYELMEKTFESLVAREIKNASELEAQMNGAADGVDGLAKSSLTLKEALAQAGPKAKELLAWVEELAIKSPYSREGVTSALQGVMAYGFDIASAQRVTKAMMDFTAGTGRSGDTMYRIALALGQIKAKGKLVGQEILQLTNAGVNVREILAKAFHVTTEELVEMQEKGLIPAEEAIEAIVKSFEEDFGGAAETQTHTFEGLTSTLHDVKDILYRGLFTPMFEKAKPVLIEAVESIASPEMQARVAEFGVILGDKVGGAFDKLTETATFFQTNVLPLLRGVWNGDPFAIAVAKIKFWEWLNGEGGVLSQAGAQMTILQETLKTEFVEAWPGIQEKLGEWGAQFWQWLTGEEGALATGAEEIGKIADSFNDWVYSEGGQTALADVGRSIGNFIGQAIKDLFSEGGEGDSVVVSIVESLFNAARTNMDSFAEIGATIEAYIIAGLIEGLTGEAMSEDTITKIKEALKLLVKSTNFVMLGIELGKEFVRGFIESIRLGLGFLTGDKPTGSDYVNAVPFGGAMRSILGFATGGVVPGPVGAPQLAVVHGGETVVPAGEGFVREQRVYIQALYLNGVQDASAFLAQLEALS